MRIVYKLIIVLAVIALGPSGMNTAATAQDTVNVPSLWDPKSRLERPEPGSIKPIRFLTTVDFPPFQFRDRRGVLIGFNVDLVAAICEVLAVQCALQTRPFDTLIDALKDNTGDAIIAGLSEPRARADDVSFTRPYFRIPARFVVRGDAEFDVANPGDGFIGVTCDTAHKAYVETFFPSLKVACYMDTATALAELKGGSINLVFADALSIASWLHDPASEGCCRFASGPFLDERYFGPGLSIVVREEDRALRDALDYAVREVHRTGVYEELYLRYFPVSLF